MFGRRGPEPGQRTPGEALRLEDVRRVYGPEGNRVVALDGVSLSLPTGSFTAVMGPSGSGKSTLLQCAAGLDRPTGGRVFVDGAELTGDGEAELTKFRRERIGFVFQQFNLLPTLSVMQNTVLPLKLAGRKVDKDRARAVLGRVGLGERLGHLPAELSGGQQQRVAIARALLTRPRVLFADEPTGALDTRSARDVLGLLRESVAAFGQTVVMVTHDPVAASFADAVLYLADGRIVGHQPAPTAESVAERMTHLADEVERQRMTAGA
ncbi:putative ABC transport system ATP-binding protein [Actinomadura coerulea]|uniref:Putative ABC transport system ATP-binding protein n=1 Tax=Actinomadura coerulea TaxID=46159 RepID=A0A7X0KZG2_9ACTN|nr:ABC transporter ATP-binding protein [Actinomadura coerulea]MBB6396407.1 putative ABC transport system ATP-binding protein [Actinomadura coerulea]GGQ06427.1 ABC transporter ATP-binding protein [Actinomadura coerulea]